MKLPATLALASAICMAQADVLPLIPNPVSVESGEGGFALTKDTAIRHDRKLTAEARMLAEDLARLTGTKPRLVAEELRIHLPSEITLDLDETLATPASGYRLVAGPKGIRIHGKDAAGAFHATRTLLQLLPASTAEVWTTTKTATVPAVTINDHPRFGWRGMMLDVGRHYQPVADVKRFIDWLAFHKFNVFHWHLTEDQGWRIEIKKYPKLTEVGAWRESSPPYGNRDSDDGKRYGGFYTQDEIREIVAYAAARHINVVPEIEMPGHAAAAITAYPEFGNTDIPGYAPKVMTRWGVHPYIFAPKEETFRFLEDILTEVCELFPSTYIHIGGDEAPKTQWEQSKFAQEVMKREGLKDEHELQSWFIRRIGRFLESKNRKLVGWDEIQEGGLPKTATMMVWRDAKWAKHALSLGNNVVMATTSHTYFDYYQNPAEVELAKGVEYEGIGGHLPIEKVYSYNPAFVAENPAQEKQILGTQAQLWSEYFKDMRKVEYMAFPRIAAIAEVAWTPLARKDYGDFSKRLQGVMDHYSAGKLHFAKPVPPPVRETRDGSKATSSLGIYQNHWPELAFDGRDDTFFWADREVNPGDHLTLELAKATTKPTEVTVATGGPASRNGDRLDQGVLEFSSNGSQWTQGADFTNGSATATAPAGTRMVRLRATKAQTNWLIVHEIRLR
jgi:hexosaminidase